MNPRIKGRLLFAIKVAVAATLITWLVRSNALDFGKLTLFREQPILTLLDLAAIFVASVLGALRWRVLLGLAHVRIPFVKVLLLQWTGIFFNVVIPGNVGGDVFKALYVARGEHANKRTTLLLIGFVERLVGLIALLVVASLMVVVRSSSFHENPQFTQLATGVVVLGVLSLIGPLAFVFVMRRAGEKFDRWTNGTGRISAVLNRLVSALRLLSSDLTSLLQTVVLSMMSHAFAIVFFTILARAILERDVAYSAMATVFPLGIVTMMVPIAPAGVGTGHAAFNWLFEQIGLTGGPTGATVFNVYLIGQLVPCLLGVIPYLLLRSEGSLPTKLEAE